MLYRGLGKLSAHMSFGNNKITVIHLLPPVSHLSSYPLWLGTWRWFSSVVDVVQFPLWALHRALVWCFPRVSSWGCSSVMDPGFCNFWIPSGVGYWIKWYWSYSVLNLKGFIVLLKIWKYQKCPQLHFYYLGKGANSPEIKLFCCGVDFPKRKSKPIEMFCIEKQSAVLCNSYKLKTVLFLNLIWFWAFWFTKICMQIEVWQNLVFS